MNLGLKSLELKGEPTDKRDELLTTLAPVRSEREGARSCLTMEAEPWKVKVRFPT